MAGVQASTAVMSKIFNNYKNNSNSNSYIGNLLSNLDFLNNKFSDFPFLLLEVDKLVVYNYYF